MYSSLGGKCGNKRVSVSSLTSRLSSLCVCAWFCEKNGGRERKRRDGRRKGKSLGKSFVINYEDLDNFSKTKCVLSDMCTLSPELPVMPFTLSMISTTGLVYSL